MTFNYTFKKKTGHLRIKEGSTEIPEKLVRKVGINLNDSKFWESSMYLMKELVLKAEKLYKQIN